MKRADNAHGGKRRNAGRPTKITATAQSDVQERKRTRGRGNKNIFTYFRVRQHQTISWM